MEIQSNHRRRVSWSDLPLEILQLIAEFLSNTLDAQNFRSVCKSWRNSTQISAFLPRSFNTSVTPQTIVSSSIYLFRSVNSPEFRPFIVLAIKTAKTVTKFFNPFTRTPFRKFPETLNPTEYRSIQLSAESHILYELSSFNPLYVKLLMYFKRSLPSVCNCRALALFNSGLVCKSQTFGKRTSFEKAILEPHDVDDIVSYRGRMYALEMNSSLRLIGKRGRVVVQTCNVECSRYRGRKRLVVSPSGEKLYMIKPKTRQNRDKYLPINLYFEVFELMKFENSWCWNLVTGFEGSDQVVFVSRDHCFFVPANEFAGCPLSNSIVFSDDAFPRYSESKCGWDYGEKGGSEVAIYSMDGKAYHFLPVGMYPGFPVMFCSPFPWVLRNPSSQSHEPVEDEMVHSDSESVSEEDEMRPSSFNSEPEEDEMAQSESDSKDGAQADATRSFPVISDTKHVTEQALETEKLEDAVVQADSVVHLLQPSHPSVKEVVTSKFQAIDVQSDHLPILEKVWTKHGDVLEGSAIHSCDTKTMALASLAKIIIILQTNNGNTLSDDQVQYLCSTFSDLQYMRLKVDWLAPCVENALAIHKSNQLQASLLELEKAKARAEEMEQKFLSEMAEMKRGLDNDIRLLTKKMPVSGQIDQKKCLGEGLF